MRTVAQTIGIAVTTLCFLALGTDAGLTAGEDAFSSTGKPIILNFRNVPIEMVLDHLSEAAGFTIVLETKPTGRVDVWSEQPLNAGEAFNLLNSVLIKNGYAAIRNGRTLTIVSRDDARTRSLPVKLGGDPAAIPATDEMVTQIIPVRFTEVGQLLKDLRPLLSTRAIVTANESANTIVVTDTQSHVRRVARLIQAIDGGAEDFTVIKVFHLQNADPTETADLLTSLFGSQGESQRDQTAMPFGPEPPMPGSFGGGPPGPGGFGDGNSVGNGASQAQAGQAQRLRKRATMTAVGDPRTASLVVSGSKDLMAQVERVVAQLDASLAGKQKVAVYQLRNAEGQQVAKVLQDLFMKDITTNPRTLSTSDSDPLETRSNTQTQRQATSSNTSAGRGAGQGGGPGGQGGGGMGAQ